MVAVDFDGTLVMGNRAPRREVVEALAEARAGGLTVVLVTGRIVEELETIWPDVARGVDCVVAENGAVLRASTWHRLLGSPIDRRLDESLQAAGVSFRRGEVVLAASLADETAILSLVRSLQLGCQTVANRDQLMVLPAGVSKASGLYRALSHLGLSFHNTVAVGDAENDLPLIETSELAVAVSNAVEPLKAAADLVLERPDGEGVADLLRSDVLAGRRVVRSARWQVQLGTTETGATVSLPASQINVLVAGGTGGGKSYLAGLLAEQLVQQDYSVLVMDPEGDHVGLTRLRGGLVVGGTTRLPEPDEVLRLLHHRYASIVVDLSLLEPADSVDYQLRLLTRVEAHRRLTGLPHWIFLDEADQMVGRIGPGLSAIEPTRKGYCLVTWRPRDLAAEVVASLDAVVAAGSAQPGDDVVDVAAAIGGVPRMEMAALLARGSGTAVLARRDAPRRAESFTVARRATPHFRHTHKYDRRPLDQQRRFYFRRSAAELTGATAGNLIQLEDELSRCERAVLRHHCSRHDFSRWVADVFRDPGLSAQLAEVEASVGDTSAGAVVEHARLELVHALEAKLGA